jgi:type II secretory pathway component PulF
LAKFEYVAKDTAGSEAASVIHAESPEAAADLLHARGLVVLSIRQVRESMRSRFATATPLFTVGVPAYVLTLFTKQLHAMLRAGLPLIRSLYGLARDEGNKALSDLLANVATRIEGGETLSVAMAEHPHVFSRLYVSMIKSGEESGTLDTILEHLAGYMERTEAIRRKVKAAVTYPAFVVVFAIVACLVLFLRVVPMMAGIYEKLGADLPGPTRVVIAASRIVGSYFWVFILLIVVLFAITRLLKRTANGRHFLDSRKLRVPIFGPILKKVVMAKFLRTLGVLVESGLPILEALELARDAAGNEVIARAADDINDSIAHGSSLTIGFAGVGVFPEVVVQMVSTGEETGTLGEMLSNVSAYYDEQVETSVAGLSSLIEPLLIVFIGAVVALILVAMFLPVFYLGAAMRQGM